ncbi:unnamed protein product [Peronospora belbahrii]|uniref:Secreted protein n=1 Tax=Peronospora belbahrii TaxID=622444 RepID=A0ABN8D1J0_9STRA|nr:unnamed protein product [Peronospora belbahrii]
MFFISIRQLTALVFWSTSIFPTRCANQRLPTKLRLSAVLQTRSASSCLWRRAHELLSSLFSWRVKVRSRRQISRSSVGEESLCGAGREDCLAIQPSNHYNQSGEKLEPLLARTTRDAVKRPVMRLVVRGCLSLPNG